LVWSDASTLFIHKGGVGSGSGSSMVNVNEADACTDSLRGANGYPIRAEAPSLGPYEPQNRVVCVELINMSRDIMIFFSDVD
jgi:hypothetical protein